MDLDLNLLRVLVTLRDERSVTRCAGKLGRSQPVVSAALAKLRAFFKDPLFLRVGNAMEPTPRGIAVSDAARGILERIEAEILAEPSFDPARSEQPLRLALSDVGEIVFLPRILEAVQRLMPRAPIHSVSLPASAVEQQLQSGELDLALGYFPDLKKQSFLQQTLFRDGFVCLMRKGHPFSGRKLSLRDFTRLGHAVVRVESRSEEVLEAYLARRGIRRRAVLTSPHFASVPMIVANSDLLVTVPEPLAQHFVSATSGLRAVDLPFDLPRIELKQYWHGRMQHDRRHRWLRALIHGMFEDRRRRG